MRSKTSFSAIAIFLSGLFVAGAAISFPLGVPVLNTTPLSCTTPSGAWTVSLVSNSTGSIPYATPCVSSGNLGKICSTYRYMITGSSTPDHVLVNASADQDLDSLNSGSSVSSPGVGDSKTAYLKYAQHEYPITLNPTPGAPLDVAFVGPSQPRMSTVVVSKGRTTESCLIAGPGIPRDPFLPRFLSQTALVAGGKCEVNLTFDTAGNVIDVNPAAGSSCIKYEGPVNVNVNGGPLRNNTGPHGITFGNGTTTCYGPPVPSVPKCICTAAPCF